MAFLLFIDESGQDRRSSPYEVLAGIAVEDSDLWNLILRIQDLEEKYFGKRYTLKSNELKAKSILKKKTFRLASQLDKIPNEERRILAKECLEDGETNNSKRHLTALAQAKLAFVARALEAVSLFKCKVFAVINLLEKTDVEEADLLRKDYVYFFERFYYFLEDRQNNSSGIILFDELEKSQCHILLNQISNYFKKTHKGRIRSNLIIPEPFFVHSDLTTGVQIADLLAYIISWGYRFKNLNEPKREELQQYVEIINTMKYHTKRNIEGMEGYGIWSIEAVE